jgi:hypothetical protein
LQAQLIHEPGCRHPDTCTRYLLAEPVAIIPRKSHISSSANVKQDKRTFHTNHTMLIGALSIGGQLSDLFRLKSAQA